MPAIVHVSDVLRVVNCEGYHFFNASDIPGFPSVIEDNVMCVAHSQCPRPYLTVVTFTFQGFRFFIRVPRRPSHVYGSRTESGREGGLGQDHELQAGQEGKGLIPIGVISLIGDALARHVF